MVLLSSISRLIVTFCCLTLALYVSLSSATLSQTCKAIADSLPPGDSSQCSPEFIPPLIIPTYIGGYETICIIVSGGCSHIAPGGISVNKNFAEKRSNGYLVGSLPLKKILTNMTFTFSVFDDGQIAFKIMTKVVVHDIELTYTKECNGANVSWNQLPDYKYSLTTDCNTSANLTNSHFFLQLVQCKACCKVTLSGRRLNGLGGSPKYPLDVLFFEDPSLSIESQQFSLEQEGTNTQLIYSSNLSSQCTSKQPCEVHLRADGVNFTVNMTVNFTSILSPETGGHTVSILVCNHLPEHLTTITATARACNPVRCVQVNSTIEIPHPFTNPADDSDMDASTPAQDSEISVTPSSTVSQSGSTDVPGHTPTNTTIPTSGNGWIYGIVGGVFAVVILGVVVGVSTIIFCAYRRGCKQKKEAKNNVNLADSAAGQETQDNGGTTDNSMELQVITTPVTEEVSRNNTTTNVDGEKLLSKEQEALRPLCGDELAQPPTLSKLGSAEQPRDGSTAALWQEAMSAIPSANIAPPNHFQHPKEPTVFDPQSIKVTDAPTLVTPTPVTEEVSQSDTTTTFDEDKLLLPKKKEASRPLHDDELAQPSTFSKLSMNIGGTQQPGYALTAAFVQETMPTGPSANIAPQDHFQQPKEPTVHDPEGIKVTDPLTMVTPTQVTEEVSESDTTTTANEEKQLLPKKQKAPRQLRGEEHAQLPTFSKPPAFVGGAEQSGDDSTVVQGAMSARPSANIAPQNHFQQPKEPTMLDPQHMKVNEPDAVIVAATRQPVNPVQAANRSREEDEEFLTSPNEQCSLISGGNTPEMVSHI